MDIDNMSNSEELFLIKHQADILINSPSHTFSQLPPAQGWWLVTNSFKSLHSAN